MSALAEYKCEQCGSVLINVDADCPNCSAQDFTDLTAKEFIDKFEKEPLPRAFYALARGAIEGEDFMATGTAAPVIITSAGQSLERDGCDFIRATFLILEHLDCPPSVRDFILCLAGLTGGDSDKWFKATDDQLAEHMGFSSGHIGNKRRELITWEQRRNMAVVEIRKGDLDHSVLRYAPTEYRVPIVGVAALFIRRVRSLPTKAAQSPIAFKKAVEDGHKDIALELCEDNLDEVPVIKERKKRKAKARTSSQEQLSEKKNKLMRLVSEYCEAAGRMGYNTVNVWNEIDGDVREMLAGRDVEAA